MRNHKEMRGSITVFLALILSLLLSIVQVLNLCGWHLPERRF